MNAPMKPILNIADVELRGAPPERTPKGETAEKYDIRWGEIATYPLKPGDIVACPTGGPNTAHQILNTGETEMRYLALSTLAEVEICDYPDSGKFGVYEELPPDASGKPQRFRHLARREDTRDYWEGE